MPTPNITLTATLTDYSGNNLGGSGAAARLRVALCGYGQTIPRVAGTAVIAQVASWPGDVVTTNGYISIKLWGNDQIAPSGTYYSIGVLDTLGNVVQSGIYQFTGSGTIDLSNATQIVQPTPVLQPSVATQVAYEFKAASAISSFTLPSSPDAGTQVLLWWNGIFQGFANGRNYSVSGAVVSLNFSLNIGDWIDVLYYH